MHGKQFVTLKEASDWASYYLGKKVTPSNISYLIQYGKIRRYDEKGTVKKHPAGITKISIRELKQYYDTVIRMKEKRWKEQLGSDINWQLGFSDIRESERTKHVHRLHPYKGKFIPQLVEYFLDAHTDRFKKVVFFKEGDTILDPFVGSGTTLVQCLELGLNSIGIDISKFNCMISEVKIKKYDIKKLRSELYKAFNSTKRFSEARFENEQEDRIDKLISSFNQRYYPNPEFKILIKRLDRYQNKIKKEIERLLGSKRVEESEPYILQKVMNQHKDETEAVEKEIADFLGRNSITFEFELKPAGENRLMNEFTSKYAEFVLNQLQVEIRSGAREKQTRLIAPHTEEISNREQYTESAFLSNWFTERQRKEMNYYLDQIYQQNDVSIQNVMKIILSRTARSCRATKHVDLATLIKPQFEPYYCRKHFKICRPVTTIIPHLKRYTSDTIRRIRIFSKLRKDVYCEVINADSRSVDVFDRIRKKNENFYRLLVKRKIDGIFTSPPYLGQIDYHEQHAYAYELFGIERQDDLEIGRMSNGVSKKAQQEYILGISQVLLNVKKYLKKDAPIFIVANDSKNLYPEIAKKSGLRIIKTFRRPVLNRTERDKQPYSESIFLMTFEKGSK